MFSINKKHIILSFVLLLNFIVIQSVLFPYQGAFIMYFIVAFLAWRIEKYLTNYYLSLEFYNLKMYFTVIAITLILGGIYIDLGVYLNEDPDEIFPYVIISYFSLFATVVGLIIAIWYFFKLIYSKYLLIKNYKIISQELNNL